MGKGSSRFFVQQFFPERQLQHYSECTYFTEQEINRLYAIFSSLSPEKFSFRGRIVGDAELRLSFEELLSIPQLHECPFGQRICEVFSSGEQGINFEDFLDMMSVYSRRAPWNLKAAYVFKIFDYDNDYVINHDDVKKAINVITDGGHGITSEETDKIVENVLEELESVSLDHLTYTEFEHMLAIAPEFTKLFTIHIL